MIALYSSKKVRFFMKIIFSIFFCFTIGSLSAQNTISYGNFKSDAVADTSSFEVLLDIPNITKDSYQATKPTDTSIDSVTFLEAINVSSNIKYRYKLDFNKNAAPTELKDGEGNLINLEPASTDFTLGVVKIDEVLLSDIASPLLLNSSVSVKVSISQAAKGLGINNFTLDNNGEIKSITDVNGFALNPNNFYSDFLLTIDFTQKAFFNLSLNRTSIEGVFGDENDKLLIFENLNVEYDNSIPVLDSDNLPSILIDGQSATSPYLTKDSIEVEFSFDERIKGLEKGDLSINTVSGNPLVSHLLAKNQAGTFETPTSDTYYSVYKASIKSFNTGDNQFSLAISENSVSDKFGNQNATFNILSNLSVEYRNGFSTILSNSKIFINNTESAAPYLTKDSIEVEFSFDERIKGLEKGDLSINTVSGNPLVSHLLAKNQAGTFETPTSDTYYSVYKASIKSFNTGDNQFSLAISENSVSDKFGNQNATLNILTNLSVKYQNSFSTTLSNSKIFINNTESAAPYLTKDSVEVEFSFDETIKGLEKGDLSINTVSVSGNAIVSHLLAKNQAGTFETPTSDTYYSVYKASIKSFNTGDNQFSLAISENSVSDKFGNQNATLNILTNLSVKYQNSFSTTLSNSKIFINNTESAAPYLTKDSVEVEFSFDETIKGLEKGDLSINTVSVSGNAIVSHLLAKNQAGTFETPTSDTYYSVYKASIKSFNTGDNQFSLAISENSVSDKFGNQNATLNILTNLSVKYQNSFSTTLSNSKIFINNTESAAPYLTKDSVEVEFSFDETIKGLEKGDLSINTVSVSGNAIVSHLLAKNQAGTFETPTSDTYYSVYKASIKSFNTGDNQFSLVISENSVSDKFGNQNAKSLAILPESSVSFLQQDITLISNSVKLNNKPITEPSSNHIKEALKISFDLSQEVKGLRTNDFTGFSISSIKDEYGNALEPEKYYSKFILETNITASTSGLSLSIKPASLKDKYGNTNSSELSLLNNISLSFDNIKPIINLLNISEDLTYEANKVKYDMKFSEKINGLETTDFMLIPGLGSNASDFTLKYIPNDSTLSISTQKTFSGSLSIIVFKDAFQDDAGNTNDSPTSFQIPFDNKQPELSSIVETQNSTPSAREFTLNFSEKVRGVDADDFILTEVDSIISINPVLPDSISYIIKLTTKTTTKKDSIQASLAIKSSDVIQDIYGNTLMTPSITKTFIFDNKLPSLDSLKETGTSTAQRPVIEFVFSEAVNNFDLDKINIKEDALDIRDKFSHSSLVKSSDDAKKHTLTLIPDTDYIHDDKTLNVSINHTGIEDLYGNSLNTPKTTADIDFDNDYPSFESLTTTVISASKVKFVLLFSEPISKLEASDIEIYSPTNDADDLIGSKFQVSSFDTTSIANTASFNLDYNEIYNGDLRLKIPASAFEDTYGNKNILISQLTDFNNVSPRLIATKENLTAGETKVKLEFSKTVSGLENSDFTVISPENFKDSFTFSISQEASDTLLTITANTAVFYQGKLKLKLNSGAVSNNGNVNPEKDFEVAFDNEVPELELVPNGTISYEDNNNTIKIPINFGENVHNVSTGDFTISPADFTVKNASKDTIKITRDTEYQGDISIDLATSPSHNITDDAGHIAIGSIENIYFDNKAPHLILISPTTSVGNIDLTLKFSESILGLSKDEIDILDNTDDANLDGVFEKLNFIQNGDSATLSLRAKEGKNFNGKIKISIPAGYFEDNLGNLNGLTSVVLGDSFDNEKPQIGPISRSFTEGETIIKLKMNKDIIISDDISGKYEITNLNGDSESLLNATLTKNEGDTAVFKITAKNTEKLEGSFYLHITNPSIITDSSGNEIDLSVNHPILFDFDNKQPELSSIVETQNSTPSAREFTLNFSEKVRGVDADDFILTEVDSIISINPVLPDSISYTIKLTTKTTTKKDSIQASLAIKSSDVIQDIYGNTLMTPSIKKTFIFDNKAPSLNDVNASSSAGDIDLTLKFSENIKSLEPVDIKVFDTSTPEKNIENKFDKLNFRLEGDSLSFILRAKEGESHTGGIKIKIPTETFTDNLGNLNGAIERTVTLGFENTKPKISSFHKSISEGKSIINLTMSEPITIGKNITKYKIINTNNEDVSTNYSVSNSEITSPGSNTIVFTISANANVKKQEKLNFTITEDSIIKDSSDNAIDLDVNHPILFDFDNTSPSISETKIYIDDKIGVAKNGKYYTNDPIKVYFKISEPVKGLQTTDFSNLEDDISLTSISAKNAQGTYEASAPNSFYTEFTALINFTEEKEHGLHLKIKTDSLEDEDGNSNTSEITVFNKQIVYDTTSPKLDSPTTIERTGDNDSRTVSVPITFTDTNSVNNIDVSDFKIVDTKGVSLAAFLSFTYRNDSLIITPRSGKKHDGDITIKLENKHNITDDAGNKATDSIKTKFDNKGPDFTISDFRVNNLDSASFKISGENIKGLEYFYFISIGNNKIDTLNGKFDNEKNSLIVENIDIGTLGDGKPELSFTITDEKGNEETKSVSIDNIKYTIKSNNKLVDIKGLQINYCSSLDTATVEVSDLKGTDSGIVSYSWNGSDYHSDSISYLVNLSSSSEIDLKIKVDGVIKVNETYTFNSLKKAVFSDDVVTLFSLACDGREITLDPKLEDEEKYTPKWLPDSSITDYSFKTDSIGTYTFTAIRTGLEACENSIDFTVNPAASEKIKKDAISFDKDDICYYGDNITLFVNNDKSGFESLYYKGASIDTIPFKENGNSYQFNVSENGVYTIKGKDDKGCFSKPFTVFAPNKSTEASLEESDSIRLSFHKKAVPFALKSKFLEDSILDTSITNKISLYQDSYVDNLEDWIKDDYEDVSFEGAYVEGSVLNISNKKITEDFVEFNVILHKGDVCQVSNTYKHNVNKDDTASHTIINFKETISNTLGLMLCSPKEGEISLNTLDNNGYSDERIKIEAPLLTGNKEISDYYESTSDHQFTINTSKLLNDGITYLDFTVSAKKDDINYIFKTTKSIAKTSYPDMDKVFKRKYCKGETDKIRENQLNQFKTYTFAQKLSHPTWLDTQTGINTSLLPNEDADYTYEFMAIDSKGCEVKLSESINVTKGIVPPTLVGNFKYCTGSSPDSIKISNHTIENGYDKYTTYKWLKNGKIFSENANVILLPSELSKENTIDLSLIASRENCQTKEITKKVEVTNFPEIKLIQSGFVEGEFTSIKDEKDNEGMDWDWRLNGNNMAETGNKLENLKLPAGIHSLEFTVSNSQNTNCSLIDSINIHISPVKILNSENIYVEDFDASSNADWIHSGQIDATNISSWNLGTPSGVDSLTTAFSGNTAWSTTAFSDTLNASYAQEEKSWVSSPWFDLCAMKRPMLSMRYWNDLVPDLDGAVLQYRSSAAETIWKVVGAENSGQNWYNTSGIVSNPGQQTGKTLGWSSDKVNEWLDGKQALDFIKNEICSDENKNYVQFRIAFSSNANVPPNSKYDGFAFDDFRIIERSRILLVENFTNETNELDHSIENDNSNILINYMNFLGSENSRTVNTSLDQGARALLYKINEGDKLIVDGKSFSDLSAYEQRKLDEILLNIDVQVERQESNFSIDLKINKLTNISDTGAVIVHVAILNPSEIINGKNYKNVLKNLLPNAAGQRLPEEWKTSETKSTDLHMNWFPDTETNQLDSVNLVVFAQNEITKEIYQAKQIGIKKLDLDIVLDTPEKSDLAIQAFPNPAKDRLNVSWSNNRKPWKCQLYDGQGRLQVFQSLNAFEKEAKLDVSRLELGIYYLKVSNDLGEHKVIKISIH